MPVTLPALSGKRIAIPESRQLWLLSEMIRKRGASVMAVPLVAIYDAPDPTPVLAWLHAFTKHPPDILILLTGEGLRRLNKLAKKHDMTEAFIHALASVFKVSRGPKLSQALRELGLEQDLDASTPTSEGIIDSLENRQLEGLRVAVQLYGQEPNTRLISYLMGRGAQLSTVAPYIYADEVEDEKVKGLINEMAAGNLDLIAFTSNSQVKRLYQVATNAGMQEALAAGLQQTAIAAVGPVVAEALRERGLSVDVMPQRNYFMKPMLNEIARFFQSG